MNPWGLIVSTAAARQRADAVLDALDVAPVWNVSGEWAYVGRAATIAWLAAHLHMSETTIRRTVHLLHSRELVTLSTVRGHTGFGRRILVTGEAR